MSVLAYSFLYYICRVKSKRKQAMLGSNLSGINLTCTNCREKGLSFSTVLFYNLVADALKTQCSFSNFNPKKRSTDFRPRHDKATELSIVPTKQYKPKM
jgi:hypothetical protein